MLCGALHSHQVPVVVLCSDSGMGLMTVNMATGYSASVEDVQRTSGDLALVEQTSDGLAVYWNEVCCNFRQFVQSDHMYKHD